MFRESLEDMEFKSLSPYATFSAKSRGRAKDEEKCTIRTDFQRDRDRIIHTKAFRRLMHKTQVFIAPQGDHYRTRLTHTLEVSQIARTIARGLSLNEDLTEAIALGHDLGHTPFGHSGEHVLDALCKKGFHHNEQSVRVVKKLEKDGTGLNLTFEVIDGIKNHRSSYMPETMEGKVVRLSDKIAYLNHDIDDTIRAKLFTEKDIPQSIRDVFGNTTKTRLNTMISDTILNSLNKNDILMSTGVAEAFKDLREFMFENVYNDERAIEGAYKVEHVISSLFDYYMKNENSLHDEFLEMLIKGEDKEVVICDAIACMTDRYAIKKFNSIFIPLSWNITD